MELLHSLDATATQFKPFMLTQVQAFKEFITDFLNSLGFLLKAN